MKTIPELSQEYSLPQSTLRDARRRSAFPSQKIGRDWLIDEQSAEFAAWLAARERQSRVKGGTRSKETSRSGEQDRLALLSKP